MIKVDKIDEGLPISVIVPLSQSRNRFFMDFVLPLIEANNPMEIIINDNTGSAPKKRNEGFLKSSQPFLYFCDDDCLLPANHLTRLYNELATSPKDIGYCYSGYKGIVLNPLTHPMRGNFEIATIDFNEKRLLQGNYISTMSLIKREYFPKFDESLKRFQDWDLWLTLLKQGIKGKAVHFNEFYAYYLDEGITSKNNNQQEAFLKLKGKHNL